MTARQQIARLLPLVLLVILVVAGLRGEVAAPRWNGPLKADGVAIGLALEVILGALLIVILRRDAAARRLAGRRPYSPEPLDLEPPAALRFTLRWVLGAAMVAVAVVLITDLHLHFLTKGKPASRRRWSQSGRRRRCRRRAQAAAGRCTSRGPPSSTGSWWSRWWRRW